MPFHRPATPKCYIPLARKRVLHYCPRCTRHRAVNLAEWERLKRDKITEQMERVRAHPQDAQAAIDLCATLVAFGQSKEAPTRGQPSRIKY